MPILKDSFMIIYWVALWLLQMIYSVNDREERFHELLSCRREECGKRNTCLYPQITRQQKALSDPGGTYWHEVVDRNQDSTLLGHWYTVSYSHWYWKQFRLLNTFIFPTLITFRRNHLLHFSSLKRKEDS